MEKRTLIHPAAVYMLRRSRWGITQRPFWPKGTTAACKAGPKTKPRVCAREIMETALVRSEKRVAAER